MPGERKRRPRNRERERQERLCYDYLERLYALTGADCDYVAHRWQVEEELGHLESVGEDLERLGYIRRFDDGARICLTRLGVDYLRNGAWRRHSIRQ
jgi:hypothetical protein